MTASAARLRDPRIHFAVNSATIGRPTLREAAYRADAPGQPCETQTRRFLGDDPGLNVVR